LSIASIVIATLALTISLWMFRMARREHREFLRSLNARASLSVGAQVAGGEEPDCFVADKDATSASVRIEIGVLNAGDKAAGLTTLIVDAPVHEEIRWCDASGRDLPGDPVLSRESITVPAPSGVGRAPVEAHRLETDLSRISLKSPVVRHVRVNVGVPAEQGAAHVVPLRILARSDDLPDDVGELRHCWEFEVRRGPW
jgi:hypothetical protein